MDKRDYEIVQYINRYCDDVVRTIKRFGNSYEIFLKDTDFYNSVSMSIMQIGELTIKLSDNFKDKIKSKIPWGLIKGMRNYFVHAYAVMDKKIYGIRLLTIFPG